MVKAGSVFLAASIARKHDDGRLDIVEDQSRSVPLDDLALPVASSLSEGDKVLVRMDDADNSEAACVVSFSSSLKHTYKGGGMSPESFYMNRVDSSPRAQVHSILATNEFRHGRMQIGLRQKMCVRRSPTLNQTRVPLPIMARLPARSSRLAKVMRRSLSWLSLRKALVRWGFSS